MLITSRAEAIRAALAAELNAPQSKWQALALVDRSGEVLGWAAAASDPEPLIDALQALARRVLAREHGLNRLINAETVEFFDWEGRSTLCTIFSADDQYWLLTGVLPAGASYKSSLARLIKRLQTILNPVKPSVPKAKSPRKKAE